MKVRELVRLLEQHNWVQVRQSGSHRQFKKEGINHVVTVPGAENVEVAKGTEKAILKQAGIR